MSCHLTIAFIVQFYQFLQKKWMKENFGPTIKNSAFSDIKILIHDDQSPFLIVVPEVYSMIRCICRIMLIFKIFAVLP